MCVKSREPLSTTTPSGPSPLSSNADVLRDVCRQSSVLQSRIIGAHDEIVMKPHEDRDLCEAFSGHDEATKHHTLRFAKLRHNHGSKQFFFMKAEDDAWLTSCLTMSTCSQAFPRGGWFGFFTQDLTKWFQATRPRRFEVRLLSTSLTHRS